MTNLAYLFLTSVIGVMLALYLGITIIEVLLNQIERRSRPWIISLSISICLMAGTCFAEQTAYIYSPIIPGMPREMTREIYKSGAMGPPHPRNDTKAIRDWYTSGEPWISVWLRLSEYPPIPKLKSIPSDPLSPNKIWQEVKQRRIPRFSVKSAATERKQ